jgi:hypothetical protein
VSGLLDKAPLELACPSCGRKVRTTIGAARRNQRLACPRGHEIVVEASQLDRELRKVDPPLANFEKSLRRLGG